ncbi:hypothetical protein AOQ84DRAFT_367270 [Glonium stellatum]|uniref:J domain-containing protein n=1 Tax=Glonium stellatum TaxID=574774 RepID=A0A8E2ETS7_9PEZI|nr:hypothetical protein AOQ84DRAFT_367270 [Glonium stellatum]
MLDAEAKAEGRKNKDLESNDDPDNEKDNIKYSMQLRNIINRVLKWPSKAHYKILGVRPESTKAEIIAAHKRDIYYVHPDKTNYPEAKKVAASKPRLNRSRDTLTTTKSRKQYDKEREEQIRTGYLKPATRDEEIAARGFKDQADESDPGSPELESDESDEDEKPDAFRQKIYAQATPSILELLNDPNSEEKAMAIAKENDKIREANIKEFESEGWGGVAKGDSSTVSGGGGKAKEGGPSTPKDSSTVKRKAKEGEPSAPGKANDEGSAAKKGSSTTSGGGGKAKEGELSTSRNWKPGQTTGGEKILGYRGYWSRDPRSGLRNPHGHQFVIEQEGEPNPVKLVAGAEVEREAIIAYFNEFPEGKRVDLTEKPAKLIGWATKPSDSGGFGVGYGLWKFKDSSTGLVNRTTLGKQLGTRIADQRVDDFYAGIGESPPWQQNLLTSGSGMTTKPKWNISSSEDDSDYSSIFVPKRRNTRLPTWNDGESTALESSDNPQLYTSSEESSDDDRPNFRWRSSHRGAKAKRRVGYGKKTARRNAISKTEDRTTGRRIEALRQSGKARNLVESILEERERQSKEFAKMIATLSKKFARF